MIRDTEVLYTRHPTWRINKPYGAQHLRPNGLSIVMPTFNKRYNLLRSVRSIFLQEYAGLPVELIIIDDGSTDGSHEAFYGDKNLQNLKPSWVDVQYIRTGIEEWTSPANSFNVGFDIAKYNYVAHNGADIVWVRRDMLKDAMGACDEDRYLMFSYRVFEGASDKESLDDVLTGAEVGITTLCPWSIITSMEALRKIQFYESGYRAGAGEDDVMVAKMNIIGAQFCRLDGHSIINQEHEKEYTRDSQWKENTAWNLSVGRRVGAEMARKIWTGELKRLNGRA